MMKSQTKIIIRNLPKCLTKDDFLKEVGNFYRYNYLRFCGTENHNKNSLTRAYINFYNEDDMYDFKNLIENKPFIDDLGNEIYCIVEFAVFQKIPAKSKIDNKQNTIATDPDFIKFAEEQKEPPKHTNIGTVESNLEEIKNKESDKQCIKTPLIEFLSNIPKKERTKKDDYRRKLEYNNKLFSKKDAENNIEQKPTSKVEMKSLKKNLARDGIIDSQVKNNDLKSKPVEKPEVKKGKSSQRNDIKAYAAVYEDYEYEYEPWENRGFENTKSYRGGRLGAYEIDDKSSYYYGSSRNPEPHYYRNYNNYGGGGGYSDYSHGHPSHSARPSQQAKSKRGSGRRPPAYSATRKD